MFFEKLSKALVLPFILLVVSPLTFYFVNINEYLIAPVDVVKYLVLAFLLVGILLFLVLLVFRKKYLFASAAMIALAAIIWLQGQILVWDFGPLDGRGVDWQRWSVHSYLEIALWVIGFFGLIALLAKNRKLQVNLCKLLFVLGAFSIGNGFFTAPERKIVEAASADESGLASVSFHPESNNILIVLDTFQSNAFSEIMEKYPEEVEFLTGFTFYPNTVGGYPTTQPSVPMMLSGEVTKNEIPIREWTRKVNSESFYLNELSGDNIYVSLAPGTLLGIDDLILPISGFKEGYFNESLLSFVDVVDGGVFKSLPVVIKKTYYAEGNWFLSRIFSKLGPSVDYGFVNYFERNAYVSTEVQSDSSFRFYHLQGAHWPLQINEYYELEENMPGNWDSYLRQSRGVLTQLKKIIVKLKELGVYETANIAVVGDHGTMPFKGGDFKQGSIWDSPPDKVLATSRPLFLIKYSGVNAGALKGGVEISDQPKHLKNVMCELLDFESCGNQQDEQRFYYFYDWSKDYHDWSKDYLPPITEYMIDGDVRDISSWFRTGYRYANGGSERLPLANRLSFDSPQYFGSESLKENSSFMISGWSHPEPNHIWSDGVSALLRFENKSCAEEVCVLKIYASAFVPESKKEQAVKVFINNVLLSDLAIGNLDWYDVRIPVGVIGESGDIRVEFNIEEPTAPCDVSDSKDCRKLGIALRQLAINEYLEVDSQITEKTEPAIRLNLEQYVLFTEAGAVSGFISSGWSGQESTHRWTDGSKATLQLPLDQSELNPNTALRLRMQANGFSPQGKDHQPVTVMVNGTEVAQWQLRGVEWHEAIISAEVAAKQWPLQVDFLIAEPTAPCEVSDSRDCRKLGMAARELVLEAVESGQ